MKPRRNAIRYRNAADKLREQQRAITRLRTKVQSGDIDSLRMFFIEVCDIISSENSHWVAPSKKEDQRLQFSPLGGASPNRHRSPA
jgi:hypothetical protein